MSKQPKIMKHLHHQKNSFLSMHKMYTYSIKTWKKNDVEAINYEGKKWINRTQLGNALGYSNIAPRTQYYSSKFKRKRYETQDCEDYEPCRMFLKEELAVTIIMDTRKTNQLYLGLNLKSINTIQS